MPPCLARDGRGAVGLLSMRRTTYFYLRRTTYSQRTMYQTVHPLLSENLESDSDVRTSPPCPASQALAPLGRRLSPGCGTLSDERATERLHGPLAEATGHRSQGAAGRSMSTAACQWHGAAVAKQAPISFRVGTGRGEAQGRQGDAQRSKLGAQVVEGGEHGGQSHAHASARGGVPTLCAAMR